MMIQWSVAVIAVAFAVLVIYLIRMLKSAILSLEETNRTLVEVQQTVNDLNVEARQVLHTVNQITVDVKNKMTTVQPLFETAHDVGQVLHSITASVKEVASAIYGREQATTGTIGRAVVSKGIGNPLLQKASIVVGMISMGTKVMKRLRQSKDGLKSDHN